jgi:FG-GAP-like repeat
LILLSLPIPFIFKCLKNNQKSLLNGAIYSKLRLIKHEGEIILQTPDFSGAVCGEVSNNFPNKLGSTQELAEVRQASIIKAREAGRGGRCGMAGKGEAMARKKFPIHPKRIVIPAGKRGRLITIGVLLSLVLAAGVFAKLKTLSAVQRQRTNSKPGAPVGPAPTSLLAATLSKEYIYAGGKLVATEERDTPSDFDGDARADIAVWRPSDLTWYFQGSVDGATVTQQFGAAGDMIVPADYDGDGRLDAAVWRPSTGVWYIRNPDGTYNTVSWGIPGDVPVPADYDHDGKADTAVFRPGNGTWYIKNSSNGSTSAVGWGTAGDNPQPADYDGDGKADVAVFRPNNGTWYIRSSITGSQIVTGWGANGDIAVPGDYDGDGKADIAVWRPSNGTWYILNSSTPTTTIVWGTIGDKPVPADYDGDSKTDIAVWRGGTWLIINSRDGLTRTAGWGNSSDLPVEGAYIR